MSSSREKGGGGVVRVGVEEWRGAYVMWKTEKIQAYLYFHQHALGIYEPMGSPERKHCKLSVNGSHTV